MEFESVGVELQHTSFNLRNTLDSIAHNFAVIAHGKGIELITHIDLSMPSLFKGDSYRIKQIVGNFLSNAIKFTDQGHAMVNADYLGYGEMTEPPE